MRQLLPEHREGIDPGRAYARDSRTPTGARPWVLLNMIASLDGATALDGVSGGLGGPADKTVFRAIRATADVILVGAGTARSERYRPPTLPAELIEARRRRGQSDLPRLAIVSRQLLFDCSLPALEDGQARPIIITTGDAPPDRLERLATQAELITCGSGTMADLPAALAILRERHGADVVLAEGGPSINGELLDLDAVDEVCLTVAPLLVGGTSNRIVHGAAPDLRRFVPARVLEQDGYLFFRHLRSR